MRNLAVAWLGQFAYMILNFVTLSVFNQELGQRYMDVQGLFTNVLVILSLSELGIGTAITYQLYKPLAEGDTDKIRALMKLFKKAYLIIGVTLLGIGFVLTPFIQHLINGETDMPTRELQLYFLCFVINSGISYFFSYKAALVTADQKKYLVSFYQYGFLVLACVAQIVLLKLTHNYTLFLSCLILSTLLSNIVIAIRVNQKYPYIKDKTPVQRIDKETMTSIKKNVFALVLHRVANIATTPVSTLIINASVGTAAIAAYYVYSSQIVYALTRIMDQVFDAIVASIGNLAVKESQERQLQAFKTTFFINALLYTCTAVPLLCVVNLFIGEIWLDPSYTLPVLVTALIVALYFVRGLRSAALSFTNAYGLYWHTRWKAVIESVALIALCLVLVVKFEIAGVVAAGIITTLLISAVYEGYVLFKHGLKHSSRWYFLRFALYVLIAAVLALIASLLCSLIPVSGVLGFLLKGLLSIFVAAAGFVAVFCRTAEFREFKSILKSLLGGLRAKA